MIILFAVRAPIKPTGAQAYAARVCEPVVLMGQDQGRPARSLVEALMEARTTLPLSNPTSTLVKSLIGVTGKMAEIVRVSGGVPMSVPAATQWHRDLHSATLGNTTATVSTPIATPFAAVPIHAPPVPVQASPMPIHAPPAPTQASVNPRTVAQFGLISTPRSLAVKGSQPISSQSKPLAGAQVAVEIAVEIAVQITLPLQPLAVTVTVTVAAAQVHAQSRDVSITVKVAPAPLCFESQSVAIAVAPAPSPFAPRSVAIAFTPVPVCARPDWCQAAPAQEEPQPQSQSQSQPERLWRDDLGRRAPPPPPESELAKTMIKVVAKLSGGAVKDMMGHPNWFGRLHLAFRDVCSPRHVFADEARNELSFWVARSVSDEVVADVMRQSGVVIGCTRCDFEPADPNDALPPDEQPPGRDVFVILHSPHHGSFHIMVQAMRERNITGDLDMMGRTVLGSNIEYAILTVPSHNTGRVEDLDKYWVDGQQLRVFKLEDAKAVFAHPGRLDNELEAMWTRSVVSSLWATSEKVE
ncbi:hypothetical protein AMAG_08009 [Allomyces macrogynus ATCC 38327]|uniref:Uncharacterized protein n=1 Tax=Allomyces macrogynus (strain ATCC 38327) TaxID=578462 RepID=A0A0L0SK20_ALLM3|nr:hypothetical protein AMAG_08009 [Allomyces macrogynus ATCC 38327]|eukprot:KNE62832.1 hypothetical protein AMAG_08009 [Allomyces macrogynus ATCC 38327]